MSPSHDAIGLERMGRLKLLKDNWLHLPNLTWSLKLLQKFSGKKIECKKKYPLAVIQLYEYLEKMEGKIKSLYVKYCSS